MAVRRLLARSLVVLYGKLTHVFNQLTADYPQSCKTLPGRCPISHARHPLVLQLPPAHVRPRQRRPRQRPTPRLLCHSTAHLAETSPRRRLMCAQHRCGGTAVTGLTDRMGPNGGHPCSPVDEASRRQTLKLSLRPRRHTNSLCDTWLAHRYPTYRVPSTWPYHQRRLPMACPRPQRSAWKGFRPRPHDQTPARQTSRLAAARRLPTWLRRVSCVPTRTLSHRAASSGTIRGAHRKTTVGEGGMPLDSGSRLHPLMRRLQPSARRSAPRSLRLEAQAAASGTAIPIARVSCLSSAVPGDPTSS